MEGHCCIICKKCFSTFEEFLEHRKEHEKEGCCTRKKGGS